MNPKLCLFVTWLAAAPRVLSGEIPKWPVPDEARIQAAISAFREAHAVSDGDEAAWQQAALSAEDEADDFALSCEAARIAAGRGDWTTAQAIIRDLGDWFDCDVPKLQGEMLTAAWERDKSAAAARKLVTAYQPLVQAALEHDQFSTATALGETAVAIATVARDTKLKSTLTALVAEAKAQADEAEQVARSRDRLATNPDDAAAHTVLGRHLCFRGGAWSAGLQHLSRGDDPVLRQLAADELAAPSVPADVVALADRWWALSLRSKGDIQQAQQQHAAELYRPQLAAVTPVVRKRIEPRLRKLLSTPAGPSRKESPVEEIPVDPARPISREIAAYFLSRGAEIGLRVTGAPDQQYLQGMEALPKDPFDFVHLVWRTGPARVLSDGEVGLLARVNTLEHLQFGVDHFQPGLEELIARQPQLRGLWLKPSAETKDKDLTFLCAATQLDQLRVISESPLLSGSFLRCIPLQAPWRSAYFDRGVNDGKSHTFPISARALRTLRDYPLEVFSVFNFNLETEHLAQVSRMSTLKHLIINATDGSHLREFGSLEKLISLGLWYTTLHKEDLAFLPSRPELISLHLVGCRLEPGAMGPVCESTQLTGLALISGLPATEDLQQLVNLRQLKTLQVGTGAASAKGVIPAALAGRMATDADLQVIAQMTALEQLHLSSSQLTPSGLEALGTLQGLRLLSIRTGGRFGVAERNRLAALLPNCSELRVD